MEKQKYTRERTTGFLQNIFGCAFSEGRLKNWTADAYSCLTQAEEQIKEQLKHATNLHVDEAGMFYENKLYWIHSASTDIYTHYGIH
jgi:Transposase IS66 family